jgi:hypothetical protein
VIIRRPKISSCLDLVGTGALEIEDARATFEAWGIQQDEELERKLQLYAGKQSPEKAFADPNMILALMKGLGIQLPVNSDDTNETEVQGIGQILQILSPSVLDDEGADPDRDHSWGDFVGNLTLLLEGDMAFDELLQMLLLRVPMNATEGENSTRTSIESLFHYDPAAAHEILAPLLEAKGQVLKNSTKLSDEQMVGEDGEQTILREIEKDESALVEGKKE